MHAGRQVPVSLSLWLCVCFFASGSLHAAYLLHCVQDWVRQMAGMGGRYLSALLNQNSGMLRGLESE
jgi:hypothetical protein